MTKNYLTTPNTFYSKESLNGSPT